jgi:hypothetical protein
MSEIGRTRLPRITIAGDGVIRWDQASASTKYLLQMKVSGDTHPRFRIRADGQLEWGSGAAAPDLTLVRNSSGFLASSKTIEITQGRLNVYQTASTLRALSTYVSGEVEDRFRIRSDGFMRWGNGTVALDVSLYRSAADQLKTDDKFLASLGIGVGNAVAAATLGNVIKKIEVFDDTGVSIGFLPVYDSIT